MLESYDISKTFLMPPVLSKIKSWFLAKERKHLKALSENNFSDSN